MVPASQRSVSDTEEFSGRLEAIDYVELRPRVAGTIDTVHFTDGALVKKGDMLFTIDPRPFRAVLGQAQAQLASAKARQELAQTQLARSKVLFEQQATSRQEVDQFNADQRTSQADIGAGEAAVRSAELNVEFTQVRAPIAGRVSRATVREGNLVNDQTLLTTIAGVSRIYAYFDASEQSFLRLQAQKASGKAPRVRMALSNESDFGHVGSLDFVDNRINPQTGAIRMRASFDNARGEFTPGLSAKMRMDSPVPYDAVLVPDRAIGTDQSKKFVYVVGADKKPEFREVKPGSLFGGMRVLTSGVKAGENVVVDGLQRVRPGAPVEPQVLQVDAEGMPLIPPPAPPGQPGAAPAAKS
ncbi:multidrug efflux RND transporter periplasmic adaptor subunit AdeF [soil metagenome]